MLARFIGIFLWSCVFLTCVDDSQTGTQGVLSGNIDADKAKIIQTMIGAHTYVFGKDKLLLKGVDSKEEKAWDELLKGIVEFLNTYATNSNFKATYTTYFNTDSIGSRYLITAINIIRFSPEALTSIQREITLLGNDITRIQAEIKKNQAPNTKDAAVREVVDTFSLFVQTTLEKVLKEIRNFDLQTHFQALYQEISDSQKCLVTQEITEEQASDEGSTPSGSIPSNIQLTSACLDWLKCAVFALDAGSNCQDKCDFLLPLCEACQSENSAGANCQRVGI